MKCPFCDNPDTKVIDSRPTEEGHAIRRRRGCDRCNKRFTTYEKVEETILMVVKKDNRREVFDRQKVLNGIVKACEKRPVSMARMEQMVDDIERELNNQMEKEVDSTYIGELIMEQLKKVDEVAYVSERMFRIAIDGPSGAGKSTIAKAVAKRLGIDYIDTGAMYRAIGLKMLAKGLPMEESPALTEMLAETEIDFDSGNVFLDGEIVNDRIRTQEVSKAASDCSALGSVRAKLVELQRKMGQAKSVIMDGRDIGTNVLTDAEYKYFLTATAEERALRRHKEMLERGQESDLAKVLEQIVERDHNDSTRALNPLCKAEDAEEIDSTNMSIDQVVDYICGKVGA